MWLWFTAQEDRCKHARHGGVFPHQLWGIHQCILPGEVDLTGRMSTKVQRKVTTNVQTSSWNTKTPDLHANNTTRAAEASRLACLHCPWIKLALGVWKGESMSWLCSLSENSPCCHCAGNWWASAERVTVWEGKHGRGKCLEGYSQGISSLQFPFFFIFYHWIGIAFLSILTFIPKTKIKINVLLCWRMLYKGQGKEIYNEISQ